VKKISIARRYAKALLLLGKEDGQTEKYREELTRVASLVSSQPELGQVISNPLYDASRRRIILSTVIESLNLSKMMSSFLMLLFDKGRFGFLSDVNEFFNKLADEVKSIARASLISATDLSSDAIEKIRSALSRKTGKTVILEVTKDPSLIGGIVTRIGDLVLDGSIKTQLLNMRETLKRGEGV
jgi:F-type H+-transporting ATPase subunit delta